MGGRVRAPVSGPQRGFTLIELLVVIGIIAVLFAVVLVAVNPARRFAESRNARRQADVRSILDATLGYIVDNKGNLPANMPPTPTSTCVGASGSTHGNGGREVMNSTDGSNLEALWHLNGDSRDSSGKSGLDGNLSNCLPGACYDISGRFSNALILNGTNQSMQTNLDPIVGISPIGSITISAWVKLLPVASRSGIDTIFGQWHDSIPYISTIKLYFDYSDSDNPLRLSLNFATGSQTYPLQTINSFSSSNIWYHIVITMDSSLPSGNVKIYVNGVNSGSYDNSGSSLVNNIAAPFIVGASYSSNDYFAGDIDDVAIWTRALSDAEIKAIALNCFNISSTIVPAYLASVPKDPQGGTDADTGYAIMRDPAGPITVVAVAPEAVGGVTPDIRVSR